MPISTYHQRGLQQAANNKSELSRTHSLFLQHFEVLEANNSPNLLNEIYALRYQVYCLENPFEDATYFNDQKEKDIFDEHSLHILIRHRGTGEAIATVRLVLPNPSNPRGQLPLEAYCGSLRNTTLKHLRNSAAYSPAEISRFAISKSAKQRIMNIPPIELGRIGKSTGNYTHWSRLLHSHLTLELLTAAMKLSYDYGLTHWYSLATPALIKILNRFAFQLTPIHPAIEHRGKRYPCLDNLEALLAYTYQECPDAWAILTNNGTLWSDSACSGQKNKNKYIA
ncbi:MAG: PEP-CTERM/exosortase system-associated acyltransferase [Candidatus Nitrosoglobus sp.]|jgi:N-acyl amino acid synthase of PEP-CTERM/exosortase system